MLGILGWNLLGQEGPSQMRKVSVCNCVQRRGDSENKGAKGIGGWKDSGGSHIEEKVKEGRRALLRGAKLMRRCRAKFMPPEEWKKIQRELGCSPGEGSTIKAIEAVLQVTQAPNTHGLFLDSKEGEGCVNWSRQCGGGGCCWGGGGGGGGGVVGGWGGFVVFGWGGGEGSRGGWGGWLFSGGITTKREYKPRKLLQSPQNKLALKGPTRLQTFRGGKERLEILYAIPLPLVAEKRRRWRRKWGEHGGIKMHGSF